MDFVWRDNFVFIDCFFLLVCKFQAHEQFSLISFHFFNSFHNE